jgi:hypothetical protein
MKWGRGTASDLGSATHKDSQVTKAKRSQGRRAGMTSRT